MFPISFCSRLLLASLAKSGLAWGEGLGCVGVCVQIFLKDNCKSIGKAVIEAPYIHSYRDSTSSFHCSLSEKPKCRKSSDVGN